jgi:hypothetical protein
MMIDTCVQRCGRWSGITAPASSTHAAGAPVASMHAVDAHAYGTLAGGIGWMSRSRS